jgi:hypothetical protein
MGRECDLIEAGLNEAAGSTKRRGSEKFGKIAGTLGFPFPFLGTDDHGSWTAVPYNSLRPPRLHQMG